MRTFDTGATRDSDDSKLEPWGFSSALVEKRYSEYMQTHQTQADGEKRASNNWMKGIPQGVYKHSLSRHISDLRLILEGHSDQAEEQDLETVLCAVKFNVDGMLYEVVKSRLQNNVELVLEDIKQQIRASVPADYEWEGAERAY